jgi:L,D-transpeptidase ErfK/SrfK
VQDGDSLSGGITTYEVRPGDTLWSIGARVGVDVGTLAFDNQLPPDARLVAGESLRVDNRHIVPAAVDGGTIVVNIAQRMLFLAEPDGIRAYPVAVGRRSWPTPVGDFTVLVAERDPTWDVPASILAESRRAGREQPAVVPPGPDNPLGAYWLGLSLPGIGIHGTTAPSSIYKTVSHGCIRAHPDDIAEIFSKVSVGTRGRTVYEPVLMALVDGEVYLEVHPDVYGRMTQGLHDVARGLAEAAGVTQRIDWGLADAALAARHGVARRISGPPAGEAER